MTATREQIRAAIEVTRAVADCIHELRQVPAGHLYARLMGRLSLEQFEQIISTLADANLVRRHQSHLLEWIGPDGPSSETHKPDTETMTAKIKDGADAKAIRQKLNPPRGTTHFRFKVPGKKPVVGSLKDIDTLAGCEGEIEFGKAVFEGRGKHAKIKGFTPIESIAPAAAKPAKAKVKKSAGSPGSKGRKPTVFGFSACAVAKALGAAGVKWEEADKIMRAHGIEMPKASLSVQLGFGRNKATWEKRGEPAPLTAEQLEELRKSVA